MSVTKEVILRRNYIMEEKFLIAKLQELRQIKPRKDWVSLTKTQILGEEPKFTFFPYFEFKPAFAGLVAVFVLFTSCGYILVKHSIPGDSLYAIRKTYHETRVFFISQEEKPAFQLKLANDRLEDLAKAPVKNLAPTIIEFQANISEAVRNLAKIETSTSSSATIKKIVEETRKIEENKLKVESLGVVVDGTEDLENALGKIVENLIKDLEERTLDEEKADILVQMKEFFEENKYSEALEIYLINQ